MFWRIDVWFANRADRQIAKAKIEEQSLSDELRYELDDLMTVFPSPGGKGSEANFNAIRKILGQYDIEYTH